MTVAGDLAAGDRGRRSRACFASARAPTVVTAGDETGPDAQPAAAPDANGTAGERPAGRLPRAADEMREAG